MNSIQQPQESFPMPEGLLDSQVRELAVMMRAARRAGQIVRAGYDQSHSIEEKAYGDLVTAVDKDCDRAVLDEIGREYPNEPVLSEEENPHADISQGNGWVVDPLDATSAMFFRSSPDMPSVMIARTFFGRPMSSVVHFPLTNEMFCAVYRHGAYKDGRRLRCAGNVALKDSWVEMNQQADSRKESDVFRRLREKLRQPGSAKLVSSSPPHSGIGVRIAEGYKRVSAVIHDNNDGPKPKQERWDVIPVKLILEEAGGAVMGFDGVEYNAFSPKPFVMAASKELAEEIIDLSRPQKAGRPALRFSQRGRLGRAA